MLSANTQLNDFTAVLGAHCTLACAVMSVSLIERVKAWECDGGHGGNWPEPFFILHTGFKMRSPCSPAHCSLQHVVYHPARFEERIMMSANFSFLFSYLFHA